MPKPRQFPVLDELTIDKVNHALRLIQEGISHGVGTRQPHSRVTDLALLGGGGSGAGTSPGGSPTPVPTPAPSNGVMNRKPIDMPALVLGDGDEIITMEYYETTGILEVGSGADLYVLGWR